MGKIARGFGDYTTGLNTAKDVGDRLEAVDVYERYRAVLKAYDLLPMSSVEAVYLSLISSESPTEDSNSAQVDNLPFIGGALSPTAIRYVDRDADEVLRKALRKRDVTFIVVQGTREVGKSSLVLRSLYELRSQGAMTLRTDFKALPQSSFNSTESLCLALIAQLSEQLMQQQIRGQDMMEELPTAEDDNRVRKMPTIGVEQFVQKRILNPRPESLTIWAMDRVDRLFGTTCGHDLFSLLRSWHDKRNHLTYRSWRRIKVILTTSTEPALFIKNINQSPFNVAQRIVVEDFSLEEIQRLGDLTGAAMTRSEGEILYELLGGHPALISQALERFRADGNWEGLATQAAREEMFAQHLARLWERITADSILLDAITSLIQCHPFSDEVRVRMQSAGIMRKASQDEIRCKLYRDFLAHKLT